MTFSLPESLVKRPLLYSGAIRLQPSDASLPAVVVPYQGYSQNWSAIPILAQPNSALNANLASELRAKQNTLCYAPNSQPGIANSIMDLPNKVPDICTGGFATSVEQTLDVSLAVLQQSPECSLRVTLVPETPLHT